MMNSMPRCSGTALMLRLIAISLLGQHKFVVVSLSLMRHLPSQLLLPRYRLSQEQSVNHHDYHRQCFTWNLKDARIKVPSALSTAGNDDIDETTRERQRKISVSLLNKVSSKKIARNVAAARHDGSSTSAGNTKQHVKSKTKDDIESHAKKMLAKTAQRLASMEATHQDQLIKAKIDQQSNNPLFTNESIEEERKMLVDKYCKYSANALKAMLDRRKVSMKKGRKPDLAKRLADLDIMMKYPNNNNNNIDESKMMNFRDDIEMARVPKDEILTSSTSGTESSMADSTKSSNDATTTNDVFKSFAGISPLSTTAGIVLSQAKFRQPSPIQKSAIPAIYHDEESVILHAETGSGKTLAYLLPITEHLWNEQGQDKDDIALIMTPTRELATQVAAVATVLAPHGSVRLITKPSNLMQEGSDMFVDEKYGGQMSGGEGRSKPRILVGSAKSIQYSLYGDGKMPAAPTPKPLAMHFLQSIRWTVLDEVDRLLNVKQTSGSGGGYDSLSISKGRRTIKTPKHEKPAAIVTAAVMRFTMGQCQVIAASATIGRPLRRELSRVLGVSPQECPRIIRGEEEYETNFDNDQTSSSQVAAGREGSAITTSERHIGRAVTIPKTVQNYIYVVQSKEDGVSSTGNTPVSPGTLLVTAASISKTLPSSEKSLLVLSRRSGLKVSTTVGALQHFGATPKPIALLDALMGEGNNNIVETPTGMMSQYQQIAGSNGVGALMNDGSRSTGSDNIQDNSYLLVTGEDSIRGLHLEGLDTVIVVGRTEGPDEYSHVAGRTGRAGRVGRVINILTTEDANKTKAWERMLMTKFEILENINDLDNVLKTS